jgi:hypothetical protein
MNLLSVKTEPSEIEFWFEFGSNYSYLSVMRIEDAARRKAVRLSQRVGKDYCTGCHVREKADQIQTPASVVSRVPKPAVSGCNKVRPQKSRLTRTHCRRARAAKVAR